MCCRYPMASRLWQQVTGQQRRSPVARNRMGPSVVVQREHFARESGVCRCYEGEGRKAGNLTGEAGDLEAGFQSAFQDH